MTKRMLPMASKPESKKVMIPSRKNTTPAAVEATPYSDVSTRSRAAPVARALRTLPLGQPQCRVKEHCCQDVVTKVRPLRSGARVRAKCAGTGISPQPLHRLMSKPNYGDDIAPADAPPSYLEATSTAPLLPGRRPSALPSAESLHPGLPPRPNQPYSGGTSSSLAGHSGGSGYHAAGGSASESSSNHLYNNSPIPFTFPRGHFCSKCKNSGFKKSGKPCHSCWSKYMKVGYNPNPRLSFKYPPGFICEKCRNTGSKLKNGKSCQDCYLRFHTRNQVRQTYGGWGTQQIFSPPVLGGGPPVQVLPGDPRLGGVVCGRCRGSGLVTFFLDQEPCPLCGGLGRLLNAPQQTGYY